MQVAQTIVAQLGGNKFLAMTGARDLVGGHRMLQFKLPRIAGCTVSCVRIDLGADDLYTVRCYAGRGLQMREVSKTEGVYAGNLRATFTEQTGLDTSL